MLPSFGMGEMLVILLLAIIIVGPKDLPKLMRTLGQWTARIRLMGMEFKQAFEEMDQDNEIAELRRELNDLKNVGKLENIAPDLDAEMKALEGDLRRGVDISSPHTPDTDPKIADPSASSDTKSND